MKHNFLTPTNVLFKRVVTNRLLKFSFSSSVGLSRQKKVNRFFVSFIFGVTVLSAKKTVIKRKDCFIKRIAKE